VSAIRATIAGAPIEWMPVVMLVFLLSWRPWAAYAPRGSTAAVVGMGQTVLVMLGLLAPSMAHSAGFWAAITVLHFAWVLLAYHAADNHQYLIGYWCLAICLALLLGGDAGSWLLTTNGRLLIGLCFLWAVLAKLAARRYRDGSMFVYLLLTDPRFMMLSTMAGGASAADYRAHAWAARRVRTGECHEAAAPVTTRLQRVALGLTWWTTGVEVFVAALFLAPFPNLDGLRAISFLAFALPTYLLVAVPAFGQVLTLMLAATVSDISMRAYLVSAAVALTLLTFLPTHLMRLVEGYHRLQMRRRAVSCPDEPRSATLTRVS
jgi:hypothetical protein